MTTTPAAGPTYSDRDRAIFDEGFRACRGYGDNHHHYRGKQADRVFAAAMGNIPPATAVAEVAGLKDLIERLPSAWREKCRECLAARSGFTFEQERGGEIAAHWIQEQLRSVIAAGGWR